MPRRRINRRPLITLRRRRHITRHRPITPRPRIIRHRRITRVEDITAEADTAGITVDGFEKLSIHSETVSPTSPTGAMVDNEEYGGRDKDGQATQANQDAGYFLEPQFE
jgi:hypothetical protein